MIKLQTYRNCYYENSDCVLLEMIPLLKKTERRMMTAAAAAATARHDQMQTRQKKLGRYMLELETRLVRHHTLLNSIMTMNLSRGP